MFDISFGKMSLRSHQINVFAFTPKHHMIRIHAASSRWMVLCEVTANLLVQDQNAQGYGSRNGDAGGHTVDGGSAYYNLRPVTH